MKKEQLILPSSLIADQGWAKIDRRGAAILMTMHLIELGGEYFERPTLKELAAELNLSPGRVGDLYKKALEALVSVADRETLDKCYPALKVRKRKKS